MVPNSNEVIFQMQVLLLKCTVCIKLIMLFTDSVAELHLMQASGLQQTTNFISHPLLFPEYPMNLTHCEQYVDRISEIPFEHTHTYIKQIMH